MSAGMSLREAAEPALSSAVAATELREAQAAFEDALSEWWNYPPEYVGVLAFDWMEALQRLRESS